MAGDQSGGSLPPPPWEVQTAEDNSPSAGTQYHHPVQTSPVGFAYSQPTPGGMHSQGSQPMGNDRAVGMYNQPVTGGHLSAINNQSIQPNQMVGVHPQQFQGGQTMGMHPQQMQYGQMGYMYPQQMYGNQMPGYGYGYGQQQNNQFLEQRMSGLSVRDDGVLRNSSYQSIPSYVPSGKPSKPEDKLFGDLVDLRKFKPTKATPGRAESR